MGLVPICRKFSDKFTIITIYHDLVRWFFRMCHNYRIIPVLFKLFVDFWSKFWDYDQLRYHFIASFTQKSLSLLNSRHGTGVFGDDKPQFWNEKWLQLILQFRIYLLFDRPKLYTIKCYIKLIKNDYPIRS